MEQGILRRGDRLKGIVFFLLICCLCGAGNAQAREKMRDFALPEVDGKMAKLKDSRGKTVLFIFGTTWCPACRAEIPHFKQIYHTYSTRGLEVLYINIMESREKVRRFIQRYNLPYRTALDETGDFSSSLGIRGVPTMILVKDGIIITRQYQEVDGQLEHLFGRR
ncbi:MAG: TlpA family protein disulfide reductase [Syntrophales bacterium]|nr:TlpA family protein disulfide reductase [Syntrophales bacterium]